MEHARLRLKHDRDLWLPALARNSRRAVSAQIDDYTYGLGLERDRSLETDAGYYGAA